MYKIKLKFNKQKLFISFTVLHIHTEKIPFLFVILEINNRASLPLSFLSLLIFYFSFNPTTPPSYSSNSNLTEIPQIYLPECINLEIY